MDFQLRPLTLDLTRLDGLSQRLIVSHHENNYAGAVKRLNAIREQLRGLDWSAAPVFVVNGLKREELISANSESRIGGAKSLFERSRSGTKNLIAARMAVFIVHFLETMQIEDD